MKVIEAFSWMNSSALSRHLPLDPHYTRLSRQGVWTVRRMVRAHLGVALVRPVPRNGGERRHEPWPLQLCVPRRVAHAVSSTGVPSPAADGERGIRRVAATRTFARHPTSARSPACGHPGAGCRAKRIASQQGRNTDTEMDPTHCYCGERMDQNAPGPLPSGRVLLCCYGQILCVYPRVGMAPLQRALREACRGTGRVRRPRPSRRSVLKQP